MDTNVLEILEGFAQDNSGIGALGLDVKSILFQAGTFVILFFIIKKYALDKITRSLKDREDTISEGLINAEKAARANEQAVQEQEKLLVKARKDADKVLATAHEEAGAIIKQAEEAASEKAERLIGDARSRIDQEIIDAKTKLKDEVTELVAAATEQILDEKIDRQKDRSLLIKALRR